MVRIRGHATINDTCPAAEAICLELFRAMPPARRLSLALGWSQSVRDLMRSSLRQQHPDLSPSELHRLFVERLLVRELAFKAYGPS